MSEDVRKKRKRISETRQNTETVATAEKSTEQTQELATKKLENVNEPIENFDWDAHMADCPTRMRSINTKVNAPHGYKVMSHEPYAQDFLNILLGQEEASTEHYSIEVGEIYDGTIYSVNPEWVAVDIGYREMVYVNVMKEEASVREFFTVGNEVKIQVLKKGDSKGFVLGSISAGVRTAVISEIMETIDSGSTAYSGYVSQMIPGGGYIVNVQGIECFMPGSLAGINKLVDFESIVDTEMYVVPVSFSQKRGTIVVSHREYLKAMIPSKIAELKENITAEITGNVTGSAKYGVFVEFNECLTGMIHVNDLSPELSKAHKAREINPGDEVKFKIKEIVSDTKIILTQIEQKPVVDLWEGIEDRIKAPAQIVGKVKAVKDYGIFVDIEKGVAGLLHISELEGIDISDIKNGDDITVTVTRIDSATRKIFLKL